MLSFPFICMHRPCLCVDPQSTCCSPNVWKHIPIAMKSGRALDFAVLLHKFACDLTPYPLLQRHFNSQVVVADK